MIPKPQHPYTTCVEVARAFLIASALWRGVVLGAIDLNRQSHCGAIEIQHEVCDGVLLAKAETIELFATQALPQALLCVGHVLAQVARGLQEGRRGWGGGAGGLFPPPTSPRWGEVSETAFSMAFMAFLICDGVMPEYPATLWRPGDRRCQSPR